MEAQEGVSVRGRLSEAIKKRMREFEITEKQLSEVWNVHPTTVYYRLKTEHIVYEDICSAFQALKFTDEEILSIMGPCRGEEEKREL